MNANPYASSNQSIHAPAFTVPRATSRWLDSLVQSAFLLLFLCSLVFLYPITLGLLGIHGSFPFTLVKIASKLIWIALFIAPSSFGYWIFSSSQQAPGKFRKAVIILFAIATPLFHTVLLPRIIWKDIFRAIAATNKSALATYIIWTVFWVLFTVSYMLSLLAEKPITEVTVLLLVRSVWPSLQSVDILAFLSFVETIVLVLMIITLSCVLAFTPVLVWTKARSLKGAPSHNSR